MYIIIFIFSKFFLQTARVQKYPEKRFDDESVAASNEGQSKWLMHRVHNVHSKFHKVDESMLPAMYRFTVPHQYDSEKDKNNQVKL